MSKSYRKSWGTWVSVKSSSHQDKTQAARSVRRAQNSALRNGIVQDIDWDGWLVPDRYECSDNDVWGWGRDGKQRPMNRSKQYNNPFAYFRFRRIDTMEDIFTEWEEKKKRDDDFIAWASRK